MKKLVVLLFSASLMIFGSSIVSAQGKYGADSAECIKYLSYYQEYYKQKNYNEAIPNWRKAFNLCPPTANQNMLVQGTTLVRQLINQNSKNSVYTSSLVDTLLMLHDIRAKYYPKAAVTALNNKALDIVNYIKDDDRTLYDELSTIAQKNGVETKPSVYFYLMNSMIALHNGGSKTTEDVISEYERCMEAVEKIAEVHPSEDLAKVKGDIENLFISSKVADCSTLVSLFTPRYESDPNSYETSATIVRILSITDGCTDNDLFVKAATSMHNQQPSAVSAYFLYKVYSNHSDVDNAVKYMTQAIESSETTAEQDADYYFELAAFLVKNGNNAKAYDCALKCVQNDADGSIRGKAYLLIGTIWGSTVCKGNEIEQRAPYWVAVDYMVKAKQADESLTDECNKYIAQYRKFYPQAADAFMYDVTDGQSYTVSCGGMTATTTVKTQQ